MIRYLITAVLVAVSALMPQPAAATPTFPYPWPDYSVVPVLFVPTNWNANDPEVLSEAAAIDSAMQEIQLYYAQKFSNVTFKLNPVSIVQGLQDREAYDMHWGPGDIYVEGTITFDEHVMLERVTTELNGRGYPTPPTLDQPGYSTIIFAKGAGGFAGTLPYPGIEGGHAMLGDYAIDSLNGEVGEGAYPLWASGRRPQIGAVAHELGHTFGLVHPDTVGLPLSSSVMGNWWEYPAIGFNGDDHAKLPSGRPSFFTVTGPALPTNVQLAPVSGTTVRLSWTDVATDEVDYVVTNGSARRSAGANASSFDWDGLTPGQSICLQVQAIGPLLDSYATPPLCTSTYVAPNPPSNLIVTAVDGTSIRLNWTDNSTDETGFIVHDGTSTVGPLPAGTTEHLWPGLTPGTYKCFFVASVGPGGESAGSNQACTSSHTVPAMPTNPVATVISGISIRLSWTDNSNNETRFEVSDGTTVVPVAADSTEYLWGGLANGTQKCLKVRAVGLAGESLYTTQVCATTPIKPAAPTNPVVTAISGTEIRITWTDKSNNEDFFEIFDGVQYRQAPKNATSFVWNGLANGTQKCLQVHAYNLAGVSAWTTAKCATTPTKPAAPTGVTAAPDSGTSIRVAWADRSGNETGFDITDGTNTRSVGANVVAFSWTGLSNGQYKCFQVRSKNLAGVSAWSTPAACATTPTLPAAPTSPYAIALNANSITVSWTDRSSNETNFYIYNGVETRSVGPNITSYTWSGLAAGTYMCFSVKAHNLAGDSGSTPYACTTTPAPPNVPGSPSATPVSNTQIRINWTDTSSNETGFQITNGVETRNLNPGTVTYTWGGFLGRTTHCFQVRSYNGAGYSLWTAQVCATTY